MRRDLLGCPMMSGTKLLAADRLGLRVLACSHHGSGCSHAKSSGDFTAVTHQTHHHYSRDILYDLNQSNSSLN